jgi:hypothetical protein
MLLTHSSAPLSLGPKLGQWKYPSKVQVRGKVTSLNSTDSSSNPTRSNVKEGYEEGMGRVLLSTRSFNPGEIVLTDKPLVHFTSLLDLAKKYAQMNEGERASIMDLKHISKPEDAEYSECRDQLQEMWIHARDLVASEPELRSCSHADVFKLFACSLFNGHSSGLDSGSAFYPLCSRASHSCSPNCMGTEHPSKPQEYAYMATKPISPGEMLTVSYTKTSQATIARRAELRSVFFK